MPIYDENNPQQSYESQEQDYLEMIDAHLTNEPIGDLYYTPISDILTVVMEDEDYD